MTKDKRQGYAILAAMGTLWAAVLAGVWALEAAHPGTAFRLADGTLSAEDTPGGGLTIVIELPVATTGPASPRMNEESTS